MSHANSDETMHDRSITHLMGESAVFGRIWSVLDEFRANSYFTLHEYAKPVLDLIFLTAANCLARPGEMEGHPSSTSSLPVTARLDHLLSAPRNDFGSALNEAFHALAWADTDLKHLDFSDFNSPKLHGADLRPLLEALSRTTSDLDKDAVPQLFESVLDRFAAASGRSSATSPTPHDIRTLLIALLKPESGMSLYDPCSGTSGLLKEGLAYVRRAGNTETLSIYGQEINSEAISFGRMNLALYGAADATLVHGNALVHPLQTDDGVLMQFDRVVSNPPFAASLRSMYPELERDPFNRFRYGLPPTNSGDFAFIQHMLASLKQHGIMAAVVSHGVLFRGGRDKEIRRGMIEDDLVEAVIGLPPALFYGTGISSAILVLSRRKPPERQGKVIFINGDKGYQRGDGRNVLGNDDINRILTCYDGFIASERFATIVTIDDIRRNDHNLIIQRYADTSALSGLVTQYDTFEKASIRDLALEVNSARRGGVFAEKPNAVYIPIVGKRVTYRLDEIAGRHDRFYQVVLGDRAINGYVAQFFGTSVGQHALSLMSVGSVTQRLGKSDLNECIIALPDVPTQKDILETHDKLASLKKAISELDRELSVNPVGLTELQAQLNSMLSVIGKLS